ncbi:MAG: PP2C family protein-serine/threonine phosphatase [Phycisphaerales bacterium]
MGWSHGRLGAARTWAQVSARAETLRLACVVVLTGLMVAFASWRVPTSEHGDQVWHVGLAMMACLAGHSALVGWHAWRRAQRGEIAVWWVRWLSVVLESALPTTIVIGLWRLELRSADEAVRSPVVLLYSLLLILSPLRLNAWMCLSTGLLSGVGYGFAVLWSKSARTWEGDQFEESVLYTTSVWLLVGGVASGFVAGALRYAVSRVMGEAEARRRAEREIASAAEVQRGLLPREAPRFEGYEFAFWSRPAEKAGGDYYDWQALPGDRLVLSLADVTGHGLGPALMAAFCRAYARASMDGAQGISEAMRRVNTLLTNDLPAGRFVTFVGVVLERGQEGARVVTAGQGPILVRRADGGVERFNADAPPLGVVLEETFESVREVRLGAGESIVLVTDGFYEWARRDGAMFGVERMCEVVGRSGGRAEEMVEALRESVEGFVGGAEQTDDLTMVVVRRV